MFFRGRVNLVRPEVCGRELIAHLRFVRMCSLKKINIWAGYLAWARRATARPVNTCSDVFVVVQRGKINIWGKHRKTLQCSHLKNTNTARAAWSQLSAASCAILSFIDYSLLSGLECSIQKSHQSR